MNRRTGRSRLVLGAVAAAVLTLSAPAVAAAAPDPGSGSSSSDNSSSDNSSSDTSGSDNSGSDTSGSDNSGSGAAAQPDVVPAGGTGSGRVRSVSTTQDDQSAQEDAQQAADDAADARAEAAEEARAEAAAQAEAAARAARARQRAVVASQQAQTSWAGHGRPHSLVIVRPNAVDTVVDGRLTQRVALPPGPTSLARLNGAVPPSWITTVDGATRVTAAMVLTPGVTLTIDGSTPTVQLAGGATPADAASVYTGSGRLVVRDATVTSVDPGSGQPVAVGAGRPFVQVSGNGRLDATNATFSNLGTPPDAANNQAGVSFGVGSGGSLVGTTVSGNSTGLRLVKSVGVRLDGLTATGNTGDGLVLQGDQGTVLTGIKAERNGGNGVKVAGPSTPRPITGIATLGNGKYGLAVVSQNAPQIRGIVTNADGAGGLQLSGDLNPTVTDFTATDQPTGVYLHVSSSRAVLDQLKITGGGRGITMEKTTDGMAVTASTIAGTQTGISIGGHQADLRDVQITDSQSGIRVERGAGGVMATNLQVTGGQDGVVVTPGTANVVLRDLVIDGAANNGIRTASPDAQILGGRISGATTGIDAEAAATIRNTEITLVQVGIRARGPDLVTADTVDVTAASSGINVADGSPFVLENSRVDALMAVTGNAQLQGVNDLSLPPLNVLGAIGIPLILLALLLDQWQRFRARRRGLTTRRLPPALRVGTQH